MTLSDAELEQRRQAARTHGLRAFEARGERSLEPGQVNRLQELREMVRDRPGREDLRRELLARTALLVEIGFAHLRQEAEAGADIWGSNVVKRLGTYLAESRRLLDSFRDETPRGSSADIIAQAIKDHDPNTRHSDLGGE